MAEFTVFYSWQSDLPRKLSRDVIHGATEAAIARLAIDATLEDSPRLDHDTQGVAGAPEITGTIFRKIEQCGVFVADLSFVASTVPEDTTKAGKRIPNPNVLLELGYATRHVGWDRVILIMNRAFGPPEDLIFDLRNRRFPITFDIGPDTRKDFAKVQMSLSSRVEEAIRACVQSEHAAVADAIGQLSAEAVEWMEQAGDREYFSVKPRTTMGEHLAFQRHDAALVRLIELRLLRFDASHRAIEYAYHWTHLGKLVLKKLGFRSSVPA